MGVGRYFCVALPFILTVASILCMLIAGLTGVTNNKNLYIFRIDLTNVTIDVSAIAAAAGADDAISDQISQLGGRAPAPTPAPQTADDIQGGLDGIASLNGLTAADLGLGKVYDINLWGYCATWQDDTHNCTKPQFNWAQGTVSANNSFMEQMQTTDGVNDTALPGIVDGMEAFEKLAKWTEVVYIIAMVGLALELAVGLFTACSRAVSCVTWLISGIATLFVVAAAVLVTVMGTVAVGTVEGALSEQGAAANYNTSYLAIIWLGALFAIAASSFWLFSVCCCKPERRPYSRKDNHGETEKFIPTGSYQPIGETHQPGYNSYGAPQRGGARSDMAYEPYSHARA